MAKSTKLFLLIFAVLLLFCACKKEKTTGSDVPEDIPPSEITGGDTCQDDPAALDQFKDNEDPGDTVWATYNASEDAPFLPKDIYDPSMYVSGLIPIKDGSSYYVENKGNNDLSQALVFKGEYGKCYEIILPKGVSGLRAAVLYSDPRNTSKGDKISYSSSQSYMYYSGTPSSASQISFMYVARHQTSYLVVYTGNLREKFQILERTMIQDTDTAGPWFTPENVGSARGGEGSFADYRWSSTQVYENLYEPYRAKYPDYISRELIGVDHSEKYDMFGYVYEPESYKTTLFITSGMHGNEETAYLALAKFMQLVADATEDGDEQLWFLRNNVRFVIVPMINVWAVSQDRSGNGYYDRSRLRYNSGGQDLNRDWENFTQLESKYVLEFFTKYKDEADIAMDLHNCKSKDYSLYYNFINFTDNAVANYKTTNHMYHRFMEDGILNETPILSNIPGGYKKPDPYIEGRIWNEFKVPTITVEHANPDFNSSQFANADEMTLACEVFGNFIIQNALFFAQGK